MTTQTFSRVTVPCPPEGWSVEGSSKDVYTADPRNPQPGQVWERDGVRNRVMSVVDLWVYEVLCLRGEDGVAFCGSAWRSWACPWWRRRKHWARCVSWK